MLTFLYFRIRKTIDKKSGTFLAKQTGASPSRNQKPDLNKDACLIEKMLKCGAHQSIFTIPKKHIYGKSLVEN